MKKSVLTILGLLILCSLSASTLELPSVFANGMIMQQNTTVKVWGWAQGGEKIKVSSTWRKGDIKTSANKQGEWQVDIPTPAYKSGEKNSLVIETIKGDTTITINDILFGEVWMCSGQSNMVRSMGSLYKEYAEELPLLVSESAKYQDKIRLFSMANEIADTPQKDVPEGKWIKPSARTTRSMPALPFFYAQNLTDSLDVPVGILWNAWGGSKIQSWMDVASLDKVESLRDEPTPTKRIVTHHLNNGIYNHKLYPLRNYTIKGFTWYQGESNIGSVLTDYQKAFNLMVSSWRELWGDKNLPFYYVQIAPYKYTSSNETNRARLVEAQLGSLDDLENVGLVPTSDVGNEMDVHPLKKKPVGFRLALLALTRTYNKNYPILPSDGSLVDKISFSGNKATVVLKRFGTNHKDGDEIIGFTLSGEDKTFYPAKAVVRLKPTRIEVSCDEVKKPVALRYAFKNFYPDANLFDDYLMPSYPFRTDNWDEVK